MDENNDKKNEKNLRSTRSCQKIVKSVLRKEKRIYGGNDLRKRLVLRWEWKREGIIDDERGDATEEVEIREEEREREDSEEALVAWQVGIQPVNNLRT